MKRRTAPSVDAVSVVVQEEISSQGRAFRDHVFLNASSNLAGTVLTLAVWFFLTPLLAHRLGPFDFSLWILATTAVTYGAFLDLGSGAAVTKYLAEHRALGEWQRARELVGTALVACAILGLGVLVLSAILAPLIPQAIGYSGHRAETVSWVIGLTGVWIAVALPASMTLAVLRGLQRFDLINVVSAGAILMLAGLVVAVLTAGGGVVAVVALGGPLELVVQVAMVSMIRRAAPELGFPPLAVSRTAARSIFSFGSAQFVIQVGSQVRGRSDEFLIAFLLPLAKVGPYSIVRRLSELPAIVSSQLEIFAPLSSELHALRDDERLRVVLTTMTRIALASTAILGTLLALLGSDFIRLWIGPAFATDADLMVIFVATTILATVCWPCQWMLMGMKRQRLPAIVSAVSALIKVVLAIVLAGAFGVKGIAASTLIATAVGGFAIVLPHGFRVAGITLRAAVNDVVLPAIGPLVPAGLLAYGLRTLIEPESFGSIIAITALACIAYLALYLALPGTASERSLVRELSSRAWRKMASATSSNPPRTGGLD